MAMIQTPVGATQERTLESIAKLEKHFLENETEAVESVFAVQGFSFRSMGQNTGIAFVKLKDWSERTDPELSASAFAGRGRAAMSQVKDAAIFVFAPPAMPELGIATGYSFYLQDNGGHGHEALIAARDQLLGMAGESALLANVRPNGQEDTPQDRKSTRLNSSHQCAYRMPASARQKTDN